MFQVHPRLRGEYRPIPISFSGISGSPPPPRGILFPDKKVLFVDRFTPASAGNTQCDRIFWILAQVHPRLRGEYSSIWAEVVTPIGSPPPPRGIQNFHVFKFHAIRFTPASAGNTSRSHIRQFPCQVHPRLRGEYFFFFLFVFYISGSPPPPRGILLQTTTR